MSRSRLALAGLAVGALLLAACGKSEPAATTTTASGSATTTTAGGSATTTSGQPAVAAPTAQYISEVAERTSSLESARFTMEYVMSGVPGLPAGTGPLQFGAQGAFTNGGQLAQITMDMSQMMAAAGASDPSVAGMGTIEMIIDGQVMYMSMPGVPGMPEGKWLKIDAAGMGGAAAVPGGSATGFGQSFEDQLKLLKGAGEVTEVGTETVDGVQLTHYKVVVDLNTALAQASPEERAQLEQSLSSQGISNLNLGTLPFDVWVDPEGRVVRLVMDLDSQTLSGLAGAAGETVPSDFAMQITMTYFDFNDPSISITVPPESDVVDMASIAGALGETPTTGS